MLPPAVHEPGIIDVVSRERRAWRTFDVWKLTLLFQYPFNHRIGHFP
jgi:hypothetical protein